MSTNFYRIWLPVSLVAHLLLLLLCRLVPLSATIIPGHERSQEVFMVTPVEKLVPKVMPKPQPPKAVVKLPVVKTVQPPPKTIMRPQMVMKPGAKFVQHPGAAPVRSPERPQGVKKQQPSVAPKVLTAPKAEQKVPTSNENGVGTEPTGSTQPSVGPTTGPVAEGAIPRPTYPKDALNEGRGGEVVLALSIDSAGRVIDVSVQSSSGSSDIDNAAKRAARRLHYRPALKNGEAVASSGTISYQFKDGTVTPL